MINVKDLFGKVMFLGCKEEKSWCSTKAIAKEVVLMEKISLEQKPHGLFIKF